MKLKKITEKAAALSMATAMLASVCAPTYTAVLSAVPVSAASSKDTTNNTATTKDLANADIIDTSKTGSITVHKYDITSAEAAGDYTEGQYKATGESDNRVERMHWLIMQSRVYSLHIYVLVTSNSTARQMEQAATLKLFMKFQLH